MFHRVCRAPKHPSVNANNPPQPSYYRFSAPNGPRGKPDIFCRTVPTCRRNWTSSRPPRAAEICCAAGTPSFRHAFARAFRASPRRLGIIRRHGLRSDERKTKDDQIEGTAENSYPLPQMNLRASKTVLEDLIQFTSEATWKSGGSCCNLFADEHGTQEA